MEESQVKWWSRAYIQTQVARQCHAHTCTQNKGRREEEETRAGESVSQPVSKPRRGMEQLRCVVQECGCEGGRFFGGLKARCRDCRHLRVAHERLGEGAAEARRRQEARCRCR